MTFHREKILEQIRALAESPVNDAVRLAFLEKEQEELIKKLDLSVVKEIKRSGNGAIELKFIDKVEALKWLSEQLDSPKAERLYQALEKNVAAMEEPDGEN